MRLITLILILAAMPLAAEKPMDKRDRYERLVLVVPLVGAGTRDDPRRPLFVPARPDASRDGLISFHYEISDDGMSAVLELVAASKSAFAPMLNQSRADVKVFEPGKVTKDEAEREIKKIKKDFDIEKLGRRGK